VKSDPVKAIKYASSFIDVGRKKGAITRKEIRLPNGHVFQKEEVMRLLDLVYYGEDRVSRISEHWARESPDPDWIYARHFREIGAVEARHARAIKNLMEGLGHKVGEPDKSFVEVFDFLESLKDWNERLLATRILFWYSYRASFGMVFYKIFYPVAPEFLRSLAKMFNTDGSESLIGENDVDEIIRKGKISRERLLWLSEQLLARVYNSIEKEMQLAKKAKVEKEAALLRNIAVAAPLHILAEVGVQLDVKEELGKIKGIAGSLG
jgi:hypothetical protein